ncbi:MAG: hypothetical protein GDA44_00725 [Prochloron sp. SP5CPC1]|nr:hypothetical protein [Candidatus Paraprochloron terpiosi SP5CPC1]
MSKDELVVKLTGDGSFTFFSPEFQETFHSRSGAKQEAEEKFVLPCGLEQLAQQKNSLQILDICYGLGYNSAAALATIWKVNPHIQIQLIALELEPRVCQKARASQLLELWKPPIPQLLATLAVNQEVKKSHLQAKLFWGDGRVTIKQVIGLNFQADAIFLDPFSPPKCPQLWTVEFLSLVAICLKPTGILATYSCAAAVRVALQLAGLTVGASKSVGRRSPGTVANKTGADLPPLSLQEREHLQTRAAIPYRDPMLKDSREIILRRRQNSQLVSLLETTKVWKKRWYK